MKAAVITWLCILVAGIVILFWRFELIYNLPTPVPPQYHDVPRGEKLAVAAAVNKSGKKPVFLHFFNPDCPCSKFNVEHFESLVRTYSNEVDFVVVPVSKDHRSPEAIKKLFHISVPVIVDTTLATLCGVYSTPQAVIVNADQTLFYRGNYNKSRYCTNKNSDYARIALDSLLNKKSLSGFDNQAFLAYGCQLPKTNAYSND